MPFIFRVILIDLSEDHVEEVCLFFDLIHLLPESHLLFSHRSCNRVEIDEGTDCVHLQLELVARILGKELFILTVDWPQNSFINAIRELVCQSLTLVNLFHFLLSIELFDLLSRRTHSCHNINFSICNYLFRNIIDLGHIDIFLT